MLKNISLILIFVFIFSACDKGASNKGSSKFGMADEGNPEFAAIEFFEHIYHKKRIEGAIKLSSPKMERLLRSYHTNKGVQKHVLNMRFDKVAIKPKTRSAGRSEFSTQMQISIFFEGELNGKIIKDLRVVDLVKINNEWKVHKVSLE